MMQFFLDKRSKHKHRLDFENNPDYMKAYRQGFFDGIISLIGIFSVFIYDLKRHLTAEYRSIEQEEFNNRPENKLGNYK